jgi:uncharacterized cupin superfamily protein
MQKINLADIAEDSWVSPKEKFRGFSKEISIALGRERASTDLLKRHPFDVEIARIPPGATPYPFHSHSAQWEFYFVMSGSGSVRDDKGQTPITSGDAFIFKPSEAHAMTNTGREDLVLLVVADNPIAESCHYPDSGKWAVQSPEKRLIRSDPLDYFDGEE